LGRYIDPVYLFSVHSPTIIPAADLPKTKFVVLMDSKKPGHIFMSHGLIASTFKDIPFAVNKTLNTGD
jgi:hypothetical protein